MQLWAVNISSQLCLRVLFYLLTITLPVNFTIAQEELHTAVKLLQEHCMRCHNSDKERGGLDLTQRESALRGGAGGAGIIPGNPQNSSIYLKAHDGTMPPELDGRPLTACEVRLLHNWILQGANWTNVPTETPAAKTFETLALPALPIDLRYNAQSMPTHFFRESQPWMSRPRNFGRRFKRCR